MSVLNTDPVIIHPFASQKSLEKHSRWSLSHFRPLEVVSNPAKPRRIKKDHQLQLQLLVDTARRRIS